ncbi:MAG: acylphosphatase [Ruminiclostridium sp.]|nr:acylphosphatase [Ruminiclostridium sp.]
MCRQRITFSGRVQNVGFRLEVVELAKRLGLTGYCDNLENGDVVAELQGAPDKIDFLVSFMEGLKRVKVTDKIVEELELVENETDFTSERKRT